jgi:hypothetical protein
MVKLFTDEEMDEKCKDYDPIPMKVSQDILHQEEREDRVNILNGVVKSPYRIGQPPSSVNMYASQIGQMTPINPDAFLKEYNRVVDGIMVADDLRIAQEMIEVEQAAEDINEEIFEAEEAMKRQREARDGEVPEEERLTEDNSRAVAVTREDIAFVRAKKIRGRPKKERGRMGEEDFDAYKIEFESTEQVGTPEVEFKDES